MENTNVVIKPEDVTLDKLLARYIKLAEDNMAEAARESEKVVTLNQYKQEQQEKNEAQEQIDNMAINIGSGLMDIIVTKIAMTTGADITAEDSKVPYEHVFELLKIMKTNAEEAYSKEGKDLYKIATFTAIDVLTSMVASRIIEILFEGIHGGEQAAATQQEQE